MQYGETVITRNSVPRCSPTEKASIFARTVRRVSDFSGKPRVSFTVKIVIALVTLVLLTRYISPSAIISTAGLADSGHLLLAAVLILPNLCLQALKWWYLLRKTAPAVTFKTALQSLLMGYPMGFITPGRLGEIGRGLVVEEITAKQSLILLAMDKTANLLVGVTTGLAAISVLLATGHTVLSKICLFLAGFLIVVVAAETIFGISRRLGVSLFGHIDIRIVLLLSGLFYLTYLSQFVILIKSFTPVATWPALSAAAASLFAKTLMPFSIADIGIRESAAVFFYNRIAVDAAVAFNAAFLLFMINIVIPTIPGLLLLLGYRRNAAVAL